MRCLLLLVVCVALSASCRYTRTSGGEASHASSRASSIQEERVRALVAHWRANAKKLRAQGDLQAAKLELLKAKNLDPRNEALAAELKAVQDVLGEDDRRFLYNYDGAPMRLLRVAEERARATVQSQIQAAQKLWQDGDRDGALAELDRAQRGIDSKPDIDWHDLPDYVQKVRKQIESDRLS